MPINADFDGAVAHILSAVGTEIHSKIAAIPEDLMPIKDVLVAVVEFEMVCILNQSKRNFTKEVICILKNGEFHWRWV